MVQKTSKQPKPKIMVVDADQGHLSEVTRGLQKEGFRVIACSKPRGALGSIRKELPDAVLLEVIMPAVSGFEIAARMQADRRLAAIPIFFITDIQSPDSRNHDYFARPLHIPSLAATLRKRIASRA